MTKEKNKQLLDALRKHGEEVGWLTPTKKEVAEKIIVKTEHEEKRERVLPIIPF